MAEKDSLIQQKEKLYVELKAILARQPGPEVAEQLSIYQASYLFFRNVASPLALPPRTRPRDVARILLFPCRCPTGHAEREAEASYLFFRNVARTFYFVRRTR